MPDRPGKYPRTITAASTDDMREQLDAEVKRQGTTMASSSWKTNNGPAARDSRRPCRADPAQFRTQVADNLIELVAATGVKSMIPMIPSQPVDLLSYAHYTRGLRQQYAASARKIRGGVTSLF